MNIDCSKYYVGTVDLSANKKVAYKNGEKIEDKQNTEGTVVAYDFSKDTEKINIDSKEDFSQIMRDIREQHGDGVMVSISGLGLNFLNINKQTLDPSKSTRSIEAKELTPDMRAEVYANVFRQEQLYGDDDKNILNHSFVNEGFEYNKDFEKYAMGYAKYLNKDLKTEYDNDVFYNLHDEELYHDEVSQKMYGYASNILSYLMMGNETEEDKKNLSNQLADAVIAYSKNVANGNTDINDISTKLKIGDTEIGYSELQKIQENLQKINETGIRPVHNNNGDNKLDYTGLGTNYDTVAYAQLGLRTAQVNHFASELSEEASKLVKDTWNKRVGNTIEEKYTKVMKQTTEILKEHFNYMGDYYKAGSLHSNYTGSKFQKVYDMFSEISGNSKEEFLANFERAMNEYNEYRKSPIFEKDGYTGTIAEKEQLDYLKGSVDFIFER